MWEHIGGFRWRRNHLRLNTTISLYHPKHVGFLLIVASVAFALVHVFILILAAIQAFVYFDLAR